MPTKGVPYHLFCEMLGMTKPVQRNNLVIYVIDPKALEVAKQATRHFDITWLEYGDNWSNVMKPGVHYPYWVPSRASQDTVFFLPFTNKNEKQTRSLLGKSTKQRAYWPAEAIAKELAKPNNISLILGNAFGIL